MTRLVLIAVCATCVAGAALAQAPGSIGVFSVFPVDGGCNIVDDGGFIQVEVLHVHHDGATAAQFKLDVDNTGWTHLGDMFNFATVIGSSITGTSVAYGACLTIPVHLVTVSFAGTSVPPCTYISIVPDPTAPTGKIEAVDCGWPDWQKIFPTGGEAIVNSTPQCNCSVPVEDTTWGGVKALYY